jgi:hypothetical protein
MKSLAAIQAYFDHLFLNAAWANVGDAGGLRPSVGGGSFYISLHTADPTVAGDQSTNEAAWAGYTRIGVARNSGEWDTTTPGQVSNVNAVAFPACTSGSETDTYYGIGTDATGPGQLIYSGPVSTQFLGFTAEVTGDISVPGSSFSVDDRVAFFPLWGDWPFPVGITEGTLYFVLTVSGDVITVSTTSGGSPATISSAGAGTCSVVFPFLISSGDNPEIAAGQAVVLET